MMNFKFFIVVTMLFLSHICFSADQGKNNKEKFDKYSQDSGSNYPYKMTDLEMPKWDKESREDNYYYARFKALERFNNEMHCFSEEINKKLAANKKCIDEIDEQGDTFLMNAVKKGYFNVVMFLVENGADVNVKDRLECDVCTVAKHYFQQTKINFEIGNEFYQLYLKKKDYAVEYTPELWNSYKKAEAKGELAEFEMGQRFQDYVRIYNYKQIYYFLYYKITNQNEKLHDKFFDINIDYDIPGNKHHIPTKKQLDVETLLEPKWESNYSAEFQTTRNIIQQEFNRKINESLNGILKEHTIWNDELFIHYVKEGLFESVRFLAIKGINIYALDSDGTPAREVALKLFKEIEKKFKKGNDSYVQEYEADIKSGKQKRGPNDWGYGLIWKGEFSRYNDYIKLVNYKNIYYFLSYYGNKEVMEANPDFFGFPKKIAQTNDSCCVIL